MIFKQVLHRYKYVLSTILVLSLIIYFHINDSSDWFGIKKDISYLDSLYYTTTTFSTVGYGDITPKSSRAKILTIIIIFGLIFNIYYLHIY